jgi:hypothetical protein
VPELEDMLEHVSDLIPLRILSDDGRERDVRELHPLLHQGPKPVIEPLMLGPAEAWQDIILVDILQIVACSRVDALDQAGLDRRKDLIPFLVLSVLGPSLCHNSPCKRNLE